MAKKAYVGVNNIARNVKAIYVGVNGVARKVVKGYIGVNGVAQLFWDGGATAVKNFWFYFKCKAEYCFTINSRTFSKKNAGIAFCYVTNRDNQNPRDHYWSEPRFASTNIDAIAYTTSIGGNFTTPLYSYQINGDTWYFNAPDYAMAGMYTPSPSEALLSTDTYVIPVYTPSQSNPRQDDMDLLDRVYCDDFAEDYQENHTYNLVKGDVNKTIRKFLAVYLFKYERWGRGSLDGAYNSMCEHLEDIIGYFMRKIGSNDVIRIGGDYPRSGSGLEIYVYYGTGTFNNVLIDTVVVDDDYSHCYGDGEWTSVGYAIADIMVDGTINYSDYSYTAQEMVSIGKDGLGYDYMEWSNIGLFFANAIKQATHSATQYLTANIIQPVYIDEELYTYVSQKGTSNSTEVRFVNLNSSSSVVYKVLLMMWNYEHTYKQFQPLYISENPFSIRIIYYRNDVLQSDTVENAVAKTRHGKTYYVRQVAGFMSTALYSCNLDLEKFTECTIYNPTTDISQWEASYIVFDGTIS